MDTFDVNNYFYDMGLIDVYNTIKLYVDFYNVNNHLEHTNPKLHGVDTICFCDDVRLTKKETNMVISIIIPRLEKIPCYYNQHRCSFKEILQTHKEDILKEMVFQNVIDIIQHINCTLFLRFYTHNNNLAKMQAMFMSSSSVNHCVAAFYNGEIEYNTQNLKITLDNFAMFR